MDSPPPAPRYTSSRPIPSTRSSRAASNSRALDASDNNDNRSELGASGSLRRGHSDGDVLGSQLRGLGSSRRTGEETWMDFLRESSSPTDDAETLSRRRTIQASGMQGQARAQERQAAMHRAAFMVADRKRRLTESQEDHARRRSASSLPFGPAVTARSSSSTITSRPEPFYAAVEHTPRPAGSSIIDRSLPRRSDVLSPRSRASREITLPRWQLDSEATSCPICGTSFSFWFRKHHCRKCGRVVCANCSPHRITIPRQFIVQPPQDFNQELHLRTDAGIEVVDLTDDTDAETPNAQRGSRDFGSPQSPVLHVDPALGGGQEVRLCNPCVPDPNPLPHLPFESPSRLGTHPFPRPEFEGVRIPSSDSSRQSVSDVPRRSSSMRHSFHQFGRRSFDQGNVPPGTESGIGSSNQQRPRPQPPPRHVDRFSPSYPKAYGSVPDRSLHDVSLLLAAIYQSHLSSSENLNPMADISSATLILLFHRHITVIVIMLPRPPSQILAIALFLTLTPLFHRVHSHHDHSLNFGKKMNARYATKRSHLKDLMVARLLAKPMLVSVSRSTSQLPRLEQADRILQSQLMQRWRLPL